MAINIGNPSVIRLVGLRRSGNHALLQWLTTNLKSRKVIHFDQVAVGRRMMSARSVWFHGQKIEREIDPRRYHEMIAKCSNEADTVTAFLEDQTLDERFDTKNLGVSGFEGLQERNVLVYRNFLNWLASCKKHPEVLGGQEKFRMGQVSTLFDLIHRWKAHASLTFGARKLKNAEITPIFYDRWVVDASYRKQWLEGQDIDPVAPDLPTEISTFGGGSSFQTIAFSGEHAAASTTHRWEYYRDNEEFRLILKVALRDEEVSALLERFEPDCYHAIHRDFV